MLYNRKEMRTNSEFSAEPVSTTWPNASEWYRLAQCCTESVICLDTPSLYLFALFRS